MNEAKRAHAHLPHEHVQFAFVSMRLFDLNQFNIACVCVCVHREREIQSPIIYIYIIFAWECLLKTAALSFTFGKFLLSFIWNVVISPLHANTHTHIVIHSHTVSFAVWSFVCTYEAGICMNVRRVVATQSKGAYNNSKKHNNHTNLIRSCERLVVR